MKIDFKQMKLLEDNITVKIIGDYLKNKIIIKLSILQIAKIFGTDKKIIDKLDFGSIEDEYKCDETREYVKKFPNIDVLDREIE